MGSKRGDAQQRLVPARLASLGSAPDQPLLGRFKSSFKTLGIWDGQHEAHFVRRGVDRQQLFRCRPDGSGGASCSTGGPLVPNGPDGLRRSSVQVGP
jgi:hypothetical protein